MAPRGSITRKTPADREARSALRRAWLATQDFLSRPRFWLLIGSGIAITALSGPVYTIQHLTLPVRIFYWGTIILTASLLQTYLTLLVRELAPRGRLHWAPAGLVATLAGLPPVYALIWLLNLRLIGEMAVSDPLKLLLFVGLPMLLINLLVAASLAAEAPDTDTPDTDIPEAADPSPVGPTGDFAPRFEPPSPAGPRLVPPLPPEPEAALPAPLLFEKLPPELGRDLICLRAQDHYIEAITPLGRAQVLMRLSDAERELGGFDGLRVHRSWWVNLDHVTGFGRTEAGGMELTTVNGLTIPVSRGQRAALRQALDQRRRAAE